MTKEKKGPFEERFKEERVFSDTLDRSDQKRALKGDGQGQGLGQD